MTNQEYNKHYHPQYLKALSFVNGVDHALTKSDENVRMQMQVIGWDENTKRFLLDAIKRMHRQALDSALWHHSDWWPEGEK